MKTTPVDVADLASSVLSVPPLARQANGEPTKTENRKMIEWLLAGGVTTYLYGGNANLYNFGVTGFGSLLDVLEDIAPPDGWMIPSIGADFGKAMDQAMILRERDFPTAMVLPLTVPATSAGLVSGFAKLADAAGRPLIAYIKNDGFLEAGDVARLFRDGAISALKYAVVRPDPKNDGYLSAILDAVGSGERIVSGIGERPAIDHIEMGLTAFTSGSVCIAPQLSTAILKACQDNEFAAARTLRESFLPLEDLRDAHSPIRVLHEAVRLAGICDTGPIGEFLSNLDGAERLDAIAAAARALKTKSEAAARGARPLSASA
ncbi:MULTISPECIES: dihydrodipicolinate synthase family protein [unclassified Sinorhizobium]|uniref:dihydrodipicolinate synthase family protein n=1 Tax=unclassified Sinorhizobium TaxID=2613772 RepID=UPI0024C2EC48|nr:MULTISPECIES: dihydrodipicolinate synthase family protein [unclassified Sinorhizobium]MDK1374403.1 dihydrodipicolinate synthase family protein [Sinorhizobium sp. 6-70]MDK1478944.1 dihydrodipicolinate synthase family protein [Sinorhizobium sp. 6-117]